MAANEWAESGRDPSLLYRGSRLVGAREWAEQSVAARPGEINALERDFLTAGALAASHEAGLVRRRTRRLRTLAAGLAVLLLAAATLSGVTLHQRGQVAHERDLALSRQVAASADRVRRTDPGLAAQLALAADRIAVTPEATAALLDSSDRPAPTRLLGPPGVMQAVVTTVDGVIVAAGGGTVRLWSRPGGDGRNHRVRRIADVAVSPGSTLFAEAVSPDGRTLAAAGSDARVYRYDLADPARPRALPVLIGPSQTVYGLAFSPDGRTLAAGSNDGSVYRWDLRSSPARAWGPIRVGAGPVHAVAFAPTPTGPVLAVGAEAGVRLYRSVTGEDPKTVALQSGPAPGAVLSVAFSPDGRRLAAGGRAGLAEVWTSRTPQWRAAGRPSVRRGPTSWINGLAFLPGGGRLMAASSDDTVVGWDLSTRSARAETPLQHPGPVAAVAVLTDGNPNGNPDGSSLVTADADGQARIWPIRSRSDARDPGTPYQLTYTADGSTLWDGSTAGAVLPWDVRDPSRPATRGPAIRAPESETLTGAAAITPDGKLLAAGTAAGRVHLWTTTSVGVGTRLPVTLPVGTRTVEWVSFDPTGRLLAVGGDDAIVTLWDVRNPAAPALLGTPLPADNYVFTMAFTPDGRRLAVGTVGGTVQLWDVADPARPTRGATLRATSQYVYSVAFSPDGSLLAAATGGKDAVLWRVRGSSAPVQLARVGGPTNNVNAVAFSPNGRRMAVGSEDGSVWLYSLGDPLGAGDPPIAIATLQAGDRRVISLAYSPDGRSLVAGVPSQVRIWTTDPSSVAASICAGRGDPITRAEWSLYLPGTPYRDSCA